MQVTLDVQSGQVLIALDAFKGGVANKRALMQTIGAGQLVSVRRTFAEEGVPKGSWAPLSESSKRWKKYTAGHKLLIGKSRLINSINAQAGEISVAIGIGVIYAAVQNFGSRDRGMAIGPQARLADRASQVKAYQYTRAVATRDVFKHEVITNKANRLQRVTRKVVSGVSFVSVGAHGRFQKIPARAFMVFRPEDLQRIREEVSGFMTEQARKAGLDVK
jgi:phage gpG-like protein